jgi:hypothetical protein
LLADAQRTELHRRKFHHACVSIRIVSCRYIFLIDPGQLRPPSDGSRSKASADLTRRGVRRPDDKDSINFLRAYLSDFNLNAHARVMEFAARSSILCAPER